MESKLQLGGELQQVGSSVVHQQQGEQLLSAETWSSRHRRALLLLSRVGDAAGCLAAGMHTAASAGCAFSTFDVNQ